MTPCGAFLTSSRRQSRRLRFLAASSASEDLIARLCDNSNLQNALTLIVCRRGDEGNADIVGVGSYFATSERSAEVAFAVDDEFHGKGIATALLERLARLGAQQDFEYFSASVLPENFEMLDVFRDSGFDAHSTTDAGSVEVRLSLQTSTTSRRRGRQPRPNRHDRLAQGHPAAAAPLP